MTISTIQLKKNIKQILDEEKKISKPNCFSFGDPTFDCSLAKEGVTKENIVMSATIFASKACQVKPSQMLTSEIFGWTNTSNLRNVVWPSATHHGENCEESLDVFCNFSGQRVKVGQKNHQKSQPNCPWNWKLMTSVKSKLSQWISLTCRTCKRSWVVDGPSQPVWLRQRGYPDSFIQTKNFKNFFTMEIPAILGLSRFGDSNHRQGTICWSHCLTPRPQHNQSFCDMDPHLTPPPQSVFSQKQNTGRRISSCWRNKKFLAKVANLGITNR